MGETPKPTHPRDHSAKEGDAAHPKAAPHAPKPGKISPESGRQLFEFVQNATDMLYTQDLTGDFTWVNPAVTRILGHSYEEAIKLNMVDVVAPEDWDLAREQATR